MMMAARIRALDSARFVLPGHPSHQRRGAGAAFKTGVNVCPGAIIAMLDADGTYTAADIPKMLEYFPEFDQVNGARTSEKGDLPLSACSRQVAGPHVREFTCQQKNP